MLTVPIHVHDRVDQLLASVTEPEARLIVHRILTDPPCQPRLEATAGTGR